LDGLLSSTWRCQRYYSVGVHLRNEVENNM
jgi:hypothetical protein